MKQTLFILTTLITLQKSLGQVSEVKGQLKPLLIQLLECEEINFPEINTSINAIKFKAFKGKKLSAFNQVKNLTKFYTQEELLYKERRRTIEKSLAELKKFECEDFLNLDSIYKKNDSIYYHADSIIGISLLNNFSLDQRSRMSPSGILNIDSLKLPLLKKPEGLKTQRRFIFNSFLYQMYYNDTQKVLEIWTNYQLCDLRKKEIDTQRLELQHYLHLLEVDLKKRKKELIVSIQKAIES